MKDLLEKQQVRFLIAGCCNTALDFLILNVLTLALGLPVLLANSISVIFGISISYALNHFFVFRYPYRITWRKFLEFFLFTGFSSLILQNIIIYLFEKFFDTTFGNSLLLLPDAAGRHVLALNLAKLCAVLIGLVWNFVAYRYIVFKKPVTDATQAVTADPASDAATHPSSRTARTDTVDSDAVNIAGGDEAGGDDGVGDVAAGDGGSTTPLLPDLSADPAGGSAEEADSVDAKRLRRH